MADAPLARKASRATGSSTSATRPASPWAARALALDGRQVVRSRTIVPTRSRRVRRRNRS
jgi:hypothetical protein